MAALLTEAKYKPVDESDKQDFVPSFAALIYPGALVNKDNTALLD